MTNEQLAILLSHVYERLNREILLLEQVLVTHGVDQYEERRHTAAYDSTCVYRGFAGFSGTCTNEDHYALVQNGNVICLDDLRYVTDDLKTQAEILLRQAAAATDEQEGRG